MVIRNITALFAVLFLFASFGATGFAEDGDERKVKQLDPKERAETVVKLRLAKGLVELGREEKDPDLLLAAAKVLSSTGGETRLAETGAKPRDGKRMTYDAKSILEEAKALGAKTDAVAAAQRSATPKPRYYCEWEYWCDYWECTWVEECWY